MNNRPVRVLYYIDRLDSGGGAQKFILENIEHINNDKIHIDCLSLDDGNVFKDVEDNLCKKNVSLFKLKGIWRIGLIGFIKYIFALNKFFKDHNDYDIIHMHGTSKEFFILYFAKKYNIAVRIVHSHNIDFTTSSCIKKFIGNALKYPLRFYATDYFACSQSAGKWLFGDEKTKDDKFHIINNAIDVDKFTFDDKIRKSIRTDMGLNDNFIIGHVGRFSKQKNHDFLLEIFNEIYKTNSTAILLLIGIGDDEKKIKEKAHTMKLDECVYFLGFKNNINEYMQAMDVFLFPSKFEGLGIVLIEAQAAGLPSFTAKEVVPQEAKVTDLLKYISLDESSRVWADAVLNISNDRTIDRKNEIEKAGYSIEQTANKLEKLYADMARRKKCI